MIERVTGAVSHAVAAGVRVCYFGVDGSRADLEFLERIFAAAVDAGASEIAVVDTIGVLSPEGAALLVRSVRGWLGPDVPIHWHGHNDFGLATAAAIAAVRAGARWVQGTINGMGERAGNASLGEVALALDALYGVETGLDLARLRETSELVRVRSGYSLDPWKPLTGETLFVRESGAVASQFHDPPAIEPYAADLLGAERGLELGKKSGLDSIRIKLSELGIERPEDDWPALLAAVKELGRGSTACSPRRSGGRSPPGTDVAIERVCIVGAGTIGSLLAGASRHRLRGQRADAPRRSMPRRSSSTACGSAASTSSSAQVFATADAAELPATSTSGSSPARRSISRRARPPRRARARRDDDVACRTASAPRPSSPATATGRSSRP